MWWSEVLDARLPASSNPMIHELRAFRQRPCLKLLNKADLADPAATKAWLDFYNAQPGVRRWPFRARRREKRRASRRSASRWRRTATAT